MVPLAVEPSLTTIGAVPTFLASVTLRHAGQKWSKKGVKGGLPAPKSDKFGVVGLDEVRGGVGGCYTCRKWIQHREKRLMHEFPVPGNWGDVS